MKPEYRLHYAPDNASLVIRLVLEELGQPYETVLVDRKAQAQNSPEYRALNPGGLVLRAQHAAAGVARAGALGLRLAAVFAGHGLFERGAGEESGHGVGPSRVENLLEYTRFLRSAPAGSGYTAFASLLPGARRC